jgi:N6-adenosine-specific RNA methylase IME4
MIVEPRREHSRKPEIYDRVEKLCSGPYLELFARNRREGWDSWGDEVDRFEMSRKK